MSSPFPKTMRSLAADGGRVRTGIVLSSLALLAGWLAWIAFGRLPLYETSDLARIEAGGSVHPVSPTVGGRVLRHSLKLGRPVRAGEVLLELESEPERWAVSEAEARRTGLLAEADAIREEIRAARAGNTARRQRDAAALEEARAQAQETEVIARLAEEEEARTEMMFRAQVVSAAERDRARAEARTRRAAALARVRAIERLEATHRFEQWEHAERLSQLQRMLAQAEGEMRGAEASLRRTDGELERLRIHAPVSGWIGEVTPLAVGAVVRPGDRLAEIVPRETVGVVADFPDRALGWIHPGQRARIQLRGFPWMQYGWVDAVVAEVGTAAEGRFRVTMRITRHDPRIPLGHGLSGSVEVEVGRTTPLALTLRTLGQRLDGGIRRPER